MESFWGFFLIFLNCGFNHYRSNYFNWWSNVHRFCFLEMFFSFFHLFFINIILFSFWGRLRSLMLLVFLIFLIFFIWSTVLTFNRSMKEIQHSFKGSRFLNLHLKSCLILLLVFYQHRTHIFLFIFCKSFFLLSVIFIIVVLLAFLFFILFVEWIIFFLYQCLFFLYVFLFWVILRLIVKLTYLNKLLFIYCPLLFLKTLPFQGW